MSKAHVAAFVEMNRALRRLKQTATAVVSHSRRAVNQTDRRDRETEKTHQATLAYLASLSDQTQATCKLVEQARQGTGADAEVYRRKVEQSAQLMSREFEGPQNDMDALGAILATGVTEQLRSLVELNEVEAQADQSRLGQLDHHRDNWQRADERLGMIRALLDQASVSAAVAIETEQHLNVERAAPEALRLNHEALTAYSHGRKQTAVALFEQAAHLAPDEGLIQLNLARMCLETGRVEAAQRACEAAARAMPGSTEVLHVEGLLALALGDHPRALAALEDCARQATSPGDEVRYSLSLAEAYYTAGQPQRAIAAWQRVLALEPLQPVAKAWLEAIL